MDKTELLEALEDSRQEMIELLDGVPEEWMTEPGVVGDWSIKEVLDHLSHWEGQLVTLLFQAKRGVAKPTTPHFGTESVDEVNKRWAEASKERALDMIWQDWMGVRKQTIRRVSEMSDQDLNDPKRFPWQEGVPLYEWIQNDSFGHEEGHADQIRQWLEKREEQAASEETPPADEENGLTGGSNGHEK